MQPGQTHRTFTIEVGHELGCETEWAKLERRALAGQNPDLFVQGYYDGDELHQFGCIRTDALVQFCQQHPGAIRRRRQSRTSRRPGRQFMVVPWDKLIKRGFVVAVYDSEIGWQGAHRFMAEVGLAIEPYDDEPGSRDGCAEFDDEAPEYGGFVLPRSTYSWLDDDDAAHLDYLLTSDRT